MQKTSANAKNFYIVLTGTGLLNVVPVQRQVLSASRKQLGIPGEREDKTLALQNFTDLS